MNTQTIFSKVLTLSVLAASALLAGCERPPVTTSQNGWRGTGMEQVTNPRTAAVLAKANKLPDEIPAIPEGGPTAKEVFKNVQVLGDLSVGQFTRTMLAITAWVSPKEGCNYCHAPGDDLSVDKLYTKTVARKMLEMTRHINNDWQAHVAATGVTCYTCHRGEPVPQNVWFKNPGIKRAGGASADHAGQNMPAPLANLTSLPYDPFSTFLVDPQASSVRVSGRTALPGDNAKNIKQAEHTFSLMTNMSQSLGVNCTFCHNTRSFDNWQESPPQRLTAFHGLSMARKINTGYMVPLTSTFPANRHGPTGDVAKVSCATCHQGVSKPLYGAPMAKDFPGMGGGRPAAAAVVVPASATKPVAVGQVAESSLLGRVTFAVGMTGLNAAGTRAVAEAVAALKADASLKAVLSGFADPSGNAEKNMELAKQRAFAVRDAIVAAGVSTDRIELQKPDLAIGATVSADSRRVDILGAR